MWFSFDPFISVGELLFCVVLLPCPAGTSRISWDSPDPFWYSQQRLTPFFSHWTIQADCQVCWSFPPLNQFYQLIFFQFYCLILLPLPPNFYVHFYVRAYTTALKPSLIFLFEPSRTDISPGTPMWILVCSIFIFIQFNIVLSVSLTSPL